MGGTRALDTGGHPMNAHPFIHISRYRTTRYWAVWRGAELIAVTVYRKASGRASWKIVETPSPKSS